MEPWLDSLSEDWGSERHDDSMSLPSGTPQRSQQDSVRSTASRSKIPHLLQHGTTSSGGGKYLNSRRGLARSKTTSVLVESTASRLNSSVRQDFNKSTISEGENGTSRLRRPSTAFSGSLNSVMHNTVAARPRTSESENTTMPEWKRRLAAGEDVGGDGMDLFSPSRLEGMFMGSTMQTQPLGQLQLGTKPLQTWSMPNTNENDRSHEFRQSVRSSRFRAPTMEILEEEEEEQENIEDSVAETSFQPRRSLSLQGVVKDRVESLEQAESMHRSKTPFASLKAKRSNDSSQVYHADDPRARTASGQEELRNEFISPITQSKQNTIKERALRDTLNVNARVLHQKLKELNLETKSRPSSRSSDDGIHYNLQGFDELGSINEPDLAELTSHSLPEDLSVGTQDFASEGKFVEIRRGGYSREGSFKNRMLSSVMPCSRTPSARNQAAAKFTSSPPTNYGSKDHDDRNFSASSGTTTPKSTIRQYVERSSPTRPSGSPLKLFGKHDTFTNNVLIRRMSKFEFSALEEDEDHSETEYAADDLVHNDFRMSEFGRGDLEGFSFRELVTLNGALSGALSISAFAADAEALGSTRATRAPSASKSTSLPRARKQAQPANTGSKITPDPEDESFSDNKRTPQSSLRERTPKRRRKTLVDEEIQRDMPEERQQWTNSPQVAGRKRKDARNGQSSQLAVADVLAARQRLQPKALSRHSSIKSLEEFRRHGDGLAGHDTKAAVDPEITQAVVEELAHFTKNTAIIQNDVRKPSVTTQDFLQEATKIMELIRQKGRPGTGLKKIEEPIDDSLLNADAILDLEIDGDTTRDSFSRPPSRENNYENSRNLGIATHDPETADKLRKYRDVEELELLASTTVLGTIQLQDNKLAEEAAEVPIPEEEEDYHSSPSGIRIRDSIVPQDVRNADLVHSKNSSDSSTKRTIPTGSSASSGLRGMIPAEKNPIPDKIGNWTFNHASKSWVKDSLSLEARHLKGASGEDPFEDIPDLSVNETRDLQRKLVNESPASVEKRQELLLKHQEPDSLRMKTHVALVPTLETSIQSKSDHDSSTTTVNCTGSVSVTKSGSSTTAEAHLTDDEHEAEVQHERHILDGKPSTEPPSPGRKSKHARVVTIAFSSPLVSATVHAPAHDSSNLTSELDELSVTQAGHGDSHDFASNDAYQQIRVKGCEDRANSQTEKTIRTFNGRPVSRIDELDEEEGEQGEMSMIRFEPSGEVTPAVLRSQVLVQPSTVKASSILCLTPLSEFSVHQTDKNHVMDVSFVGSRAQPSSLRQAHGPLALSTDDVVKAITDAEPYEPYWEQIRKLTIMDKGLGSLHRLDEYCSTLEELHISYNQVTQLAGAPTTLRNLYAQYNNLSSLTPWNHLHNLQYVDVSNNDLNDLNGFDNLIHLRELRADNNQISNIDGVFDLNGLLSLRLRGNELRDINLSDSDLTRLTHLDLSNNNLVQVQGIEALQCLRYLNLKGNKLLCDPATSKHLTLERLDLSSNNIMSFNLSLWPHLEALYLDKNAIQHIDGLSTSRHLSTLSLREQRESPNIVAHVFAAACDVRKLFLSSNNIADGLLPLPSHCLLNLQYLELASCGITHVAKDFGKRIPNCRVFNLNFNALKDITYLSGITNLNKLLVANNRINKLRRSCLGFSTFKVLRKLDVRGNPLTVGFYAPDRYSKELVAGNRSTKIDPEHSSFELAKRAKKADEKWLRLLDEGTTLRRRTIELLLAEGCEQLINLDGLAFDRQQILVADDTWRKLVEIGVLRRPGLVQKQVTASVDLKQARNATDELDDRTGTVQLPLDVYISL